jgi:hypothetical protein
MSTQLKITCPVCNGSGEETYSPTGDPQEAVPVICHCCEGEGHIDEGDIEYMICNVRMLGMLKYAKVFEELLRRAKG